MISFSVADYFPISRVLAAYREDRTSDIPRMSYGFHIFGIVRAVTTIKYAINAIIAHPTTTARMRFSLRSFRFWAFLCPSMRSACSGRKSVMIRGAVAPGSELGFRTKYVKGMVTIPTTVSTKKGKNCPYSGSVSPVRVSENGVPVHRMSIPFHSY